jgi:hypothetical protein
MPTLGHALALIEEGLAVPFMCDALSKGAAFVQ